MEEMRQTTIPDTPELRMKIRQEAYQGDTGGGQTADAAAFDYHHLLMRIRSQGLKGRIKQVIFQLTRFLTLWQEQFNRQAQQRMAELDRTLTEATGRTHRELEIIEERLKEQRRLVFERPAPGRDSAPAGAPAPAGTDLSGSAAVHSYDGLDADIINDMYAAFEERFRGSSREVEKRLSIYLPLIREQFLVPEMCALDIGCGRGEWLRLLAARGMRAKGIDTNRMFIQRCREDGLDVEAAAAPDYLKTMAAESFQVITAFHVIEHLDFDRLVVLLDEVYRTLAPGGLLILETPNPVNILVGACDFYRDPSHVRPLHPDTVRFLAGYRGFTGLKIKLIVHEPDHCRLEDFDRHTLDTIDDYIDIARDYALIACKPASGKES